MAWWRELVLSVVIFTSHIDAEIDADQRPTYIYARVEQFPYQASLRFYDEHLCSGSIISDRHIITAAHCFDQPIIDSETLEGLTVVTGTSFRYKGGKTYGIVGPVDFHPSFKIDENRYVHDLAIIKLNETIVFDETQQKLELPEQLIQNKHPVNLTGWEWSSPVNRPEQLFMTETAILSRDECQRRQINPNITIDISELCTTNGSGIAGCHADNGSPLVANGQLIGIYSWTEGEGCETGYPDVFTNVYHYKEYISRIIKKTA